ncbi:MAG: UbiX family flavin prenyltransferase [Planctomycetota bacterium]
MASRAEPEEARRSFAVAMTGASGAAYGIRLIEALSEAGHEVHFMLSGPARRVLCYEEGLDLGSGPPDLERLFRCPERVLYHPNDAVEAAPASGSAGIEALVVCPCSMGPLARIAHGYSIGLIERAADVMLKEGRTLVLVPRETPLGLLHLENMQRLAQLGAVLLPAMPGFYHRPESVQDLIDFVVGKILGRLRVESRLCRRWKTPEGYEDPT